MHPAPPTMSEIVKLGVWIGEMLSRPFLEKRKAWPLELSIRYKHAFIGPQQGVSSTYRMGHVALEFVIVPHHVPIYIQSVSLEYTGGWFSGVRSEPARRDDINEYGEHELVGTQINSQAHSPFYSAWFEFVVPDGCQETNIEAKFVIMSEGKACEANLGSLHLRDIMS